MASLLTRRCLRSPPLLRHNHPTSFSLSSTNHRFLHVRSVSIFTGLGRLAGRTAGRGALGLGVGAGALTWAEYKVDGSSLFLPHCVRAKYTDSVHHRQVSRRAPSEHFPTSTTSSAAPTPSLPPPSPPPSTRPPTLQKRPSRPSPERRAVYGRTRRWGWNRG
jgi:hypothetical protein